MNLRVDGVFRCRAEATRAGMEPQGRSKRESIINPVTNTKYTQATHGLHIQDFEETAKHDHCRLVRILLIRILLLCVSTAVPVACCTYGSYGGEGL